MRHIPEAGAVCGNSARTDLCGGRGVTSVPTATEAPAKPAAGRYRYAFLFLSTSEQGGTHK